MIKLSPKFMWSYETESSITSYLAPSCQPGLRVGPCCLSYTHWMILWECSVCFRGFWSFFLFYFVFSMILCGNKCYSIFLATSCQFQQIAWWVHTGLAELLNYEWSVLFVPKILSRLLVLFFSLAHKESLFTNNSLLRCFWSSHPNCQLCFLAIIKTENMQMAEFT